MILYIYIYTVYIYIYTVYIYIQYIYIYIQYIYIYSIHVWFKIGNLMRSLHASPTNQIWRLHNAFPPNHPKLWDEAFKHHKFRNSGLQIPCLSLSHLPESFSQLLSMPSGRLCGSRRCGSVLAPGERGVHRDLFALAAQIGSKSTSDVDQKNNTFLEMSVPCSLKISAT